MTEKLNPPSPPGVDARWIDRSDEVVDLVAELGDEPRLAIDTEFHRERTYWPTCALLQIAWAGGSALVDPLTCDIGPLGALLRGRTIVMHASGQDLEVFQRELHTTPDDLFDTQIAASFLGMSSIGLAALVRRQLDITLPKADRLTDWLARPLPENAMRYAAADVAHLLEIHDQLSAALEERGRLSWFRAECRDFVERSVAPGEPDAAWWRIKEARRLRGTAAAVAQEVAKWREAHAAHTDRPVRTVLPDLALASIAQRPPTTVDDLLKTRGLRDRGLAKSVRADLLAAVQRGVDLPQDAIWYPDTRVVPGELRAALPVLSAWVSQRCRELDLDPAVVATRSDLEAYLCGEQSRLSSGWREEAVADDIAALLAGDACLSFERGTGLALRFGCRGDERDGADRGP